MREPAGHTICACTTSGDEESTTFARADQAPRGFLFYSFAGRLFGGPIPANNFGDSVRLINKFAEFKPRAQVVLVPHDLRGIYFLLRYHPRLKKYDVVYVGMSAKPHAGMGGRLRAHAKSKHKVWTHFSIYQVSDKVDEDQIRELEGLIRYIYRKATKVHKYNRQRKSNALRKVRVRDLADWES